jgi:hypothetical protein
MVARSTEKCPAIARARVKGNFGNHRSWLFWMLKKHRISIMDAAHKIVEREKTFITQSRQNDAMIKNDVETKGKAKA